MKALAIFDETGTILALRYGDDQYVPKNIRCVNQEIPDGASIDGVDISNPNEPTILFTPSRENNLEKQVTELIAQVAYLQMMSGIETEVNHE